MDSMDGDLIGWRVVMGELYSPHFFQHTKAKGPVSLCGSYFSIEEDLVPPPPGSELCAMCTKKSGGLSQSQMIETQEQYEKIMRSAHNLVAGSIDLEATFNALRKVATAQMHSAKKFYADHVYPHALEDFDEWLKIAHPDLSALPSFLTDEGE